MLALGQGPTSFKRIYVDGTAIPESALPLKKHRRLFDKGPHMSQLVHKRAETTLDYFFDLETMLEHGESIEACRAYVDVVSTPLDDVAPQLWPANDIRLYVDSLGFAETGVLVKLRGGSDNCRYNVSIQYTTDRGLLNLLRFSVHTVGEAIKIAVISCTTHGGFVGTRPADEPPPPPPPPPSGILISVSDAVLSGGDPITVVTISVSDATITGEAAPELGNGPVTWTYFNGVSWESATSITFSETNAGDNKTTPLRLANGGTLPVSVGSATVQGSAFSFAGPDNNTSWTIPAGGQITGTVTFAPTTAGAATGQLSLVYGVQPATLTIGLSGTAVAPPIQALKRVRIFGNQFYASDSVNASPTSFLRLKSVNWFGAEGTNYTPHGTWARRYTDIIDQIKSMGFNCIRLPFSGEFCTPGRTPPASAFDASKNQEFVGKTALEIFDLIIDYCGSKGIYVVLDHHRRWAGAGADGKPTDATYTQANWLASWGVMATRYKDNNTVIGADVHNEPHDLTWDEWATAVEACGNHIHTIASNWIIFVEGVGSYQGDSYWWGGQLKGVRDRPVTLSMTNRVAYSPHEYGQSVGSSQSWLAYDNQTPPANWPLNLTQVWDTNWGFIFYENIAPLWIGEMGGHFGYDADSGAVNKPHATQEREWMSRLVRYLNFDRDLDGTVETGERPALPAGQTQGISFAYWSYNPNSGDTGGLVRGDWTTPQQGKLDLIAPLLTNP